MTTKATTTKSVDTFPRSKYQATPSILTRSRSIIQDKRQAPPCITVGLRPTLEVFESDTPLEFKVIYLGEPLPLITWKKNNEIIEENPESIKTKLNCSILYFSRIQAEDTAVYSCSVENDQGRVETRCNLSVLPKATLLQNSSQLQSCDSPSMMKHCPPTVLDHLKSTLAEDGSCAELSCKIVCPPCSFDVVWIHNGKEIKPSKDFQYHHQDSLYSLKIPELFPEDSGIYTCEAFNDFGETFTSCSLSVTCPGKNNSVFKTFPKSVSVQRGAPIVVQAELSTINPDCDRQVTWIKDGNVVNQSQINAQGKVQFSIVEAGLRDAGLYELHASIKEEKQIAAFAIIVL